MSLTPPTFTPQVLLDSLSILPAHKRLLTGFSGGADSTALLLALHRLQPQLDCKLVAVHFNHGLQESAANWEKHCREFCQQYGIALQVHHLDVQVNPGSSPETRAREARYDVIRKIIEHDDIYLTAHQADDQAETLLINLMRGSGETGLAAIQPLSRFSRGWLARPLLNVRRSDLEAWLEAQQVTWINDPSNSSLSMDRNFLRNQVIPILDKRWPGVVARLQQTAKLLQQRSAAFDEMMSNLPGLHSENSFTLDLDRFQQASGSLQAEIIRSWARQRGAPPPPGVRLKEFLSQLQKAGAESHAELVWRGWIIRHHKGTLWLHALPAPGPCPQLNWGHADTLELGQPFGQLHWPLKASTPDIRKTAWICSRSRISRNREINRTEKNKLKEIMRISGIPDWLRDSIPLLWFDGKLAAVGDCWKSPEFRRLLRDGQSDYTWAVSDPLLLQVQSICHNSAVDPRNSLV